MYLMQQVYLYILIASLTIASPGPGILLTLTNTLNYSLRSAIAGIVGVATGMGVISVVAASSVGIIITTSQLALLTVKLAGSLYLAYLGVKLFRSVPRTLGKDTDSQARMIMPSARRRFHQGLIVTLLNPKPIVFFMALFPQFINAEKAFVPQFALLSATFCILVFFIHFLYGLFAHMVKNKMTSGRFFGVLNKAGGTVFLCFASGLMISSVYSYL